MLKTLGKLDTGKKKQGKRQRFLANSKKKGEFMSLPG